MSDSYQVPSSSAGTSFSRSDVEMKAEQMCVFTCFMKMEFLHFHRESNIKKKTHLLLEKQLSLLTRCQDFQLYVFYVSIESPRL